jgi:hypothetical protein
LPTEQIKHLCVGFNQPDQFFGVVVIPTTVSAKIFEVLYLLKFMGHYEEEAYDEIKRIAHK